MAELRRRLADRIRQSGVGDTPELDARILVGYLLGCDASAVVLRDDEAVSGSLAADADRLAERRLSGWPVARIVGEKEFWGLTLRVGPETLIPRPDTETIVEAALDRIDQTVGRSAPLSVLDLGTGSGAILLALIHDLPEAYGVGVDVSQETIRTAWDNAQRNKLSARLGLLVSDWGTALRGRFDAIVSNPPYIRGREIAGLPLEVRDHDPYLALDGGDDGLNAYRRVVEDVSRLLKPDGFAVLEIGFDQADSVSALAAVSGFGTETFKDIGGRDRAVVLNRLQK